MGRPVCVRSRRRRVVRGLFALALLVASAPGAVLAQDSGDSGSSTDAQADGSEKRDEASEETSESEYDWEDEEALFDVESEERGDDVPRDETGDEEERRPGVPLAEMSKEQAQESGFDFGDRRQASRRTTAVLLAASAGSVLHGIGHWYGDDRRTATFLAGLEGAGLVLAGAGLTTWALERETPAGATVGSKAFHLGVGVFTFSYLLDVVGAIRTGDVPIPATNRSDRRVTVEAGYYFLQSGTYPLNHHFQGGLNLRFGRFFGRVETDQEFGLEASAYGAEVGVRVLQGGRDATYAYVVGAGEYLDFRGTGPFDRWRGDLRVGGSMDLGIVSSHLERVALGLEGGWGFAWHAVDGSDGLGPSVDTAYIPIAVFSRFDVTERVQTELTWEQVPPRRLRSSSDLGGVGRVELVYDSTDLFDLELGTEFAIGDGFSIYGNLLFDVLR